MWILVILGYLAITGYKTEADCKDATRALWTATAYCVPAAKDGIVVMAR